MITMQMSGDFSDMPKFIGEQRKCIGKRHLNVDK